MYGGVGSIEGPVELDAAVGGGEAEDLRGHQLLTRRLQLVGGQGGGGVNGGGHVES